MLWRVIPAGPPTHWLVTLADGLVVDVWADSLDGPAGAEDHRDYRFANLMDISPSDQDGFSVTARSPGMPSRVEVAIARFPQSSVVRVSVA